MSTALGCEDTNHPPGAPPCESLAIDASPSDGAPRMTIPCPLPVPSTGGVPGGYSAPPLLVPGGNAAGSPGTGGASEAAGVTGSGGATGFGGFTGAAGLTEPGSKPGCCG